MHIMRTNIEIARILPVGGGATEVMLEEVAKRY
jgi:hypothetical protein